MKLKLLCRRVPPLGVRASALLAALATFALIGAPTAAASPPVSSSVASRAGTR